MVQHSYFGKVEQDWAGFAAEYSFAIPYFDASVQVFLGEEFDEDGEEVDTPPTPAQLDEYAKTLKNFLENIDEIIVAIQEKAFERYLQLYAHFYEEPFTVESFFKTELNNGATHPPLNIDSKEKHFAYMKEILDYIRILDNDTLKIPIHYDLDTEHGLELKIVANRVQAIGGIAET